MKAKSSQRYPGLIGISWRSRIPLVAIISPGLPSLIPEEIDPELPVSAEVVQGKADLFQLDRFREDKDLGILRHLRRHVFGGFDQETLRPDPLFPAGLRRWKRKIDVLGEFKVSKEERLVVNQPRFFIIGQCRQGRDRDDFGFLERGLHVGAEEEVFRAVRFLRSP